jgi:hypothetical protein
MTAPPLSQNQWIRENRGLRCPLPCASLAYLLLASLPGRWPKLPGPEEAHGIKHDGNGIRRIGPPPCDFPYFYLPRTVSIR